MRLSPRLSRVGTALRELREERDLTQRQLAKKAGVAPTFLSDIERHAQSQLEHSSRHRKGVEDQALRALVARAE
jgi:transcriptional regulator with XRE-family HTH domain